MSTPLMDHLDRVGRSEGGVIEFELGEGAQNPDLDDVCNDAGFVVAATDQHGHVMIVEVKISANGRGITAIVSTYDDTGEGRYPSVSSMGHQSMVTVDCDVDTVD